MTNTFKLTRQNFNHVKTKYEKHHAFECPRCHQEFKEGDIVVRTGHRNGRYFHQSCLESMRV